MDTVPVEATRLISFRSSAVLQLVRGRGREVMPRLSLLEISLPTAHRSDAAWVRARLLEATTTHLALLPTLRARLQDSPGAIKCWTGQPVLSTQMLTLTGELTALWAEVLFLRDQAGQCLAALSASGVDSNHHAKRTSTVLSAPLRQVRTRLLVPPAPIHLSRRTLHLSHWSARTIRSVAKPSVRRIAEAQP